MPPRGHGGHGAAAGKTPSPKASRPLYPRRHHRQKPCLTPPFAWRRTPVRLSKGMKTYLTGGAVLGATASASMTRLLATEGFDPQRTWGGRLSLRGADAEDRITAHPAVRRGSFISPVALARAYGRATWETSVAGPRSQSARARPATPVHSRRVRANRARLRCQPPGSARVDVADGRRPRADYGIEPFGVAGAGRGHVHERGSRDRETPVVAVTPEPPMNAAAEL